MVGPVRAENSFDCFPYSNISEGISSVTNVVQELLCHLFHAEFYEHRQVTNDPRHANSGAAVLTHFNLPSHSTADMKLIPLKLQTTFNTSRRKAREAYLLHKGKNLSPDGINRRNER